MKDSWKLCSESRSSEAHQNQNEKDPNDQLNFEHFTKIVRSQNSEIMSFRNFQEKCLLVQEEEEREG